MLFDNPPSTLEHLENTDTCRALPPVVGITMSIKIKIKMVPCKTMDLISKFSSNLPIRF